MNFKLMEEAIVRTMLWDVLKHLFKADLKMFIEKYEHYLFVGNVSSGPKGSMYFTPYKINILGELML